MALKDTDDAKPETEDADVSLDMSQAAVNPCFPPWGINNNCNRSSNFIPDAITI